ncbi:histidine phosphatase family protein [Lacticaseibacillus zhaodongensis]|uniref:histidine phosphatase family protein n=1 Tax=Lacticaseibacillus zhaodongensis TaxID=2668065 RepID=UPI0012D2D29F|nr:histidine phosphatase family protein [Lacticaseibacillus zhaodongensis]
MKRIFIIRHGKTAWNLEKRLQGAHADSELLTDDLTGYKQLAHYLADYHFAGVYSSPIRRATHTAEIVTQAMGLHGVHIQPLPGLTEISFGQWEGKRRDDLIAQHRELFVKLSHREDDPRLQALGMESFAAAGQRFTQALRDIAGQLGADDNALVVTHGGIGQLGIRTATGNDRLLGLKNLSTSIVAFKDGQFYLDVYNQTAYLKNVDLNEGNVSIL